MFTGAMVALMTPFQDGEVDYNTLDELLEFQLENGIDALVPTGTTGESPTLSHNEHKKVIKHIVKTVAGQVPVIPGTGSNSTQEAIELTEYAKKVGADATLQVDPYYNKPTQEGFYRHFKTIAETVDLPVILYDIPGRCGAGMTPQTIARLSEIENIVALKEATGDMDHASAVATLCDLTILSGDDSMTLPLAAVGGKGAISVVANIVPADIKAMTDLILSGELTEARKWHNKLFDLSRGMLKLATNPIPIKAAASMLNLASEEMRLPMVPLDDDKRETLRKTLDDYGLL